MSEKLMSDERQEQLVKAAEDVIGLMNIGVEPSAAMAKVAEDTSMNDHEIDVVAHAVNNSRQLAHLQDSKGDEREAEFPLINPDKVRAYGDTQPTTNADVNTGDRYGSQEVPGDNVEANIDAPDARDIQKSLSKAANSIGDYRLRKGPQTSAEELRAAWGIDPELGKVADYEDPNPFAKIDEYRIGDEEASLRYTQKVAECQGAIAKVAESMRLMTAPAWKEVESTAIKLGCSDEILDIIYGYAGLEKFGEARADKSQIKVAGVQRVPQKVYDLAQDCVRADTFWKEAADISAARNILKARYQTAYNGLFPKQSQVADYVRPSASIGDLVEPTEKATQDFSGLSPDVIQEAFGGGEAKDKYEYKGPDRNLRQEMANTDVKADIESLMSDDYIAGHSLPEVIEAYNAAMSVNPNFGSAEMRSYIKQHLATQGAVPLDLQIRARPKQETSKD